MKLVIGNKNYSSWSLRPWILLSHFNVSFEEIRIPLFTDDTLNNMANYCPNNKVPVLIDEDIHIWDSLAICEYINEQYLANKGWPIDIKQRAMARALCAEMHSGFMALREEMPMNCRRQASKIAYSSAAQRDIERIIAVWSDCLSRSKGDYLFDTFSIADAYFLPIVIRFTIYQVDVPTNISNYIACLMKLPAYQDWLSAAKIESEVIACEEI
ncbi:glutathione S-transferase family protein [Thalassotalea ganghwensis]